jgi:hypothetical protein
MNKYIDTADKDVRLGISKFIKEFNRREWRVRIQRDCSFNEYANRIYKHDYDFGYGFVVDSRPVPYFHPNRSFHDEIIWLNTHLFYNERASFADKLMNSAIVKFYGPSRTLAIITGNVDDLPYLTKTDSQFIEYEKLVHDEEYLTTLHENIETAFRHGESIWGTTELRTSLQTASRNYCRDVGSVIDRKYNMSAEDRSTRKMRPSDMISWVKYLMTSDENHQGWLDFYKTKPTMKQSFEYLTSYRGIGNYYGYHFSSNLARMPGIGAPTIIEVDFKDKFSELGISHGNLDENDDYVMAGPGAMASLASLYPKEKFSSKKAMEYIIGIRDCQEDFFMIDDEESIRHLNEATELGRFTTFGCEISLCQYNVFTSSYLSGRRI